MTSICSKSKPRDRDCEPAHDGWRKHWKADWYDDWRSDWHDDCQGDRHGRGHEDRHGRCDKDDYSLARPREKVEGQTAAEWLEEWWTWILQSPSTAIPANDPTGDLADNQPENPVFFVAGTFGGPANRTFEVPDEPLIVPVITAFITGDTPATTNRDINQFIRNWPATVTDVHASIDGEEVENIESYLVKTDLFSLGEVLPDSLLEALGVPAVTELARTRAVGYVLVIEDLEPGGHELVFGGSLADGFVTETTASITVVPDYCGIA